MQNLVSLAKQVLRHSRNSEIRDEARDVLKEYENARYGKRIWKLRNVVAVYEAPQIPEGNIFE
jgi:hypothetical protein